MDCGTVFESFSALSVKEMESSSVISSMDNTLRQFSVDNRCILVTHCPCQNSTPLPLPWLHKPPCPHHSVLHSVCKSSPMDQKKTRPGPDLGIGTGNPMGIQSISHTPTCMGGCPTSAGFYWTGYAGKGQVRVPRRVHHYM
jgi:hypothetical protein